METREGMNALIIETGFLGDAIVSLSLARAIKESVPNSRVAFLVRPDAREIIAASPDVNAVITFDKRGAETGIAGIRKKAEELSVMEFDTLFLLHSSHRSQRLVSLMICKVKIGFEGVSSAKLTQTIPDAGWQNRYERAVLPLRAIVPNVSLEWLPRIVPPAVSEIRQFIAGFEKAIVLAPGSAWETKKWGDEKYFELANALAAQGYGIIIIGGSSEAALGKRISEACVVGTVLNLAGRATFLESMYAIQLASLIIANDSAPVHAAVAVGTKVLAIFGPTVPAFGFAPPVGSGEVIELPGLWCRPCTPHGSHTCPIYSHECMKAIPVSAVLERINAEL